MANGESTWQGMVESDLLSNAHVREAGIIGLGTSIDNTTTSSDGPAFWGCSPGLGGGMTSHELHALVALIRSNSSNNNNNNNSTAAAAAMGDEQLVVSICGRGYVVTNVEHSHHHHHHHQRAVPFPSVLHGKNGLGGLIVIETGEAAVVVTYEADCQPSEALVCAERTAQFLLQAGL